MNIKNFVLGIGILIIYGLTLWQGLETFYPTPEWNDYCELELYPKVIDYIGVNCTIPQSVREAESSCNRNEGIFRYQYDDKNCVIGGECDFCQKEYNSALDVHLRNVFIISLIIAVITFIVGFSILSVEPVGSALLASGVWAVFYGTVQKWRNFGNAWRFILLLVVLVILIWIALRLNRKKKGFFGFFR